MPAHRRPRRPPCPGRPSRLARRCWKYQRRRRRRAHPARPPCRRYRRLPLRRQELPHLSRLRRHHCPRNRRRHQLQGHCRRPARSRQRSAHAGIPPAAIRLSTTTIPGRHAGADDQQNSRTATHALQRLSFPAPSTSVYCLARTTSLAILAMAIAGMGIVMSKPTMWRWFP